MMRLLLLILITLFSFPALADDLDYAGFGRIPVQHEGRIKPLDTVGRIYLKSFSGRESVDGLNDRAWLAETLFNPAKSMQRPIFRIFRPELLNLPERDKHLYSFMELASALQTVAPSLEKLRSTDAGQWNEDQQELARLQDYSVLYTQLLRSFSLILPLNITPPPILAKEWGLKSDDVLTLQAADKHRERLETRIRKIVKAKGDNLDRYTDQEQQIAAFAFEMQILFAAGENNVLMRVIPDTWSDNTGEWLSPWSLTRTGKGSPESAKLMGLWKDAAAAYLANNAAQWDTAITSLRNETDAVASPFRLSLELAYNSYHPLQVSMFFYLAAFLAFAAWALNSKKLYYKVSFIALTGGFIFNFIAIISRILILQRPPVGTLYESILFVSLICASIALWLELRRKDGNGLLIGGIAGGLLLFLAEGFAEDDSLRMLVAVLNTNFWLGTHVLCITLGYGLCLITAGYAHLYLIRRINSPERANELAPSVKTLSLLSLLFTAVGTILGGIWADQSWGRFWGWDPKENGALFIVLWLIWLLHGQISGHLNRLTGMVATASLAVVVAIAWFGVNLLNVGLHSYGFITGVAGGLAAFCTAEIIVIGFLWYKIHAQKVDS